MTVEKIVDTLTNAGFNVNPAYPYVVVSLKRKINKMEVWAALNYQGNTDNWLSCNDGSIWIEC